jgi:hypothetical protein
MKTHKWNDIKHKGMTAKQIADAKRSAARTRNEYMGSTLDSFLKEEGIYNEVRKMTMRRVAALDLIAEERHLSPKARAVRERFLKDEGIVDAPDMMSAILDGRRRRRSKRCIACGNGKLVPVAKSGRKTRYKEFEMTVPVDAPIDTCDTCGAEGFNKASAEVLDLRLEEARLKIVFDIYKAGLAPAVIPVDCLPRLKAIARKNGTNIADAIRILVGQASRLKKS